MTTRSIRILTAAVFFLGALTVAQPSAIADSVSLTLTSPPGLPSDGATAGDIYLSPYYFTIATTVGSTTTSKTNVPLICDDFSDEIYQGETWNVTVGTGRAGIPTSGLSGTAAQYGEVGYLANQLDQASSTDITDQAALSFAIWSILNPGSGSTSEATLALSYLSSQQYQVYEADLGAGAVVAGSPSLYTQYLNALTIYQPASGWPIADGTPQQFVSVNTSQISAPEAASTAFLGFDLLALFGAVCLVRRRSISDAAKLS
jgi:hypothetical protein